MSSYGVEKRRDIARSVLPSTKSNWARHAKRAAHHAVRSRVREAILRGDWEQETDLHLDAQRYDSYSGVKYVVFERRNGDKLGPLMRWAEAKADELGDTPAERYAAMRAILPPNLIGWHAMTHVDNLEQYDLNPIRRFGRYKTWNAQNREAKRAAYDETLEIAQLVLNVGGHQALNIELRKAAKQNIGQHVAYSWNSDTKRHDSWKVSCDYCGVPRFLEGLHDVDAFARDITERAFARDHWSLLHQRHVEGLEAVRRSRPTFV